MFLIGPLQVYLKQMPRSSRSQGEFATIVVPPGYLPKKCYAYPLQRGICIFELAFFTLAWPSCQILFGSPCRPDDVTCTSSINKYGS